MQRLTGLLLILMGVLLSSLAAVTLLTQVVPNLLKMGGDAYARAAGQVAGGLMAVVVLAIVGRRASSRPSR